MGSSLVSLTLKGVYWLRSSLCDESAHSENDDMVDECEPYFGSKLVQKASVHFASGVKPKIFGHDSSNV